MAALVSIDGQTEIRPALAKAVFEKGFELFELSLQRNSLEDIFHVLTQGANNDK